MRNKRKKRKYVITFEYDGPKAGKGAFKYYLDYCLHFSDFTGIKKLTVQVSDVKPGKRS